MLTRNERLGHLAMLTFSALVAGSFSFGTRVANLADPAAFMALRFALGGLIIGVLAFSLRRFEWSYLTAGWRYFVLGGLFGFYFAMMFEGLKTATPVSAVAVFTLMPLMSAGFGRVLLGQPISARLITALLIGAAGALWVIFDGKLDQAYRLEIGRGEVIYFIGCIAHALYTPMTKKLNRGEPVLFFTFGMMVAGFLLLAVWSFEPLTQTEWASKPAMLWWVLAYLAIFASASTFFLLQYAALRISSAKAMAYTYLTPSWVVALEFFGFGQVPEPVIFVGIGLTMIALLILLKTDSPVAIDQRAKD